MQVLDTLSYDELVAQLSVTAEALVDAISRKAGDEVVHFYRLELDKIREAMNKKHPLTKENLNLYFQAPGRGQ